MSGESQLQGTATKVRLARRLAKPRAFFPWGFVPAAGLAALFLFGVGPFAFASIEADTRATAEKALADAGAAWATPRVSGQWVVIEGEAPSKDAADAAVAAVRAAPMTTLFGAAVPATRVTRHVPDLPGAPQAEPPPVDPAARPEPVLEAPPPADPAVQAPVQAAPPPPAATQVPTLDATPAAPTCAQLTTDFLARERIEFASASAALTSASITALDELASIAASCPGGFRIEGHTDDRGNSDLNYALSLRRAEAVRAALIKRGMAPERVIAAGRGPDSPVADNATDEGRARNRRIDIQTLPPT